MAGTDAGPAPMTVGEKRAVLVGLPAPARGSDGFFSLRRRAQERIDVATDSWLDHERPDFETVAHLFGDAEGEAWELRHLPLSRESDGWLFTHVDQKARFLCTLPRRGAEDWTPDDRRALLSSMLASSHFQGNLAALVWEYGMRSTTDPSSIAFAVALFDVWLDENHITGDESDGLRLLLGFGNYMAAMEYITRHGVTQRQAALAGQSDSPA